MNPPYIAGIVGSRRRNTYQDRKMVYRLVAWLYGREKGAHAWFSIVSGGCLTGADAFADDAARLFEPPLDIVVFPIDKKGTTTKWKFTQKAYERNRLVAEKCSELFALVSDDRTGGTENTIKQALELKKPVHLVFPDGSVYLSSDGTKPTCEPEILLLNLKYTG